MKKKAFTLVELLVVIAIIAMLLAILMPALNKVRQIAYRMVCGSNLSGLGKACMVYANDYQESYPVIGGTSTLWTLDGQLTGGGFSGATAWSTDASTFTAATGPSYLTQATNTASMYLLVKYSDVSTKQFVCKATDAKAFELTLVDAVANPATVKDVTQVWDFGPNPGTKATRPYDFCSYAYQMSLRAVNGGVAYPIMASSGAGLVIMADKNPWYDKGAKVAAAPATSTTGPKVLVDNDLGITGTTQGSNVLKDEVRKANSTNHQSEGQEVLFADGHVSWETQPNVGIEQDNIYTPWSIAAPTTLIQKQGGIEPIKPPSATAALPQSAEDTFLAN